MRNAADRRCDQRERAYEKPSRGGSEQSANSRLVKPSQPNEAFAARTSRRSHFDVLMSMAIADRDSALTSPAAISP
jgi:hypothetical protein